jgi:hypothetical protein
MLSRRHTHIQRDATKKRDETCGFLAFTRRHTRHATGTDLIKLFCSLYIECNKLELVLAGNTKGESITVLLTSCLTELD